MKGLVRSFLMAFSGYSVSPKTKLTRNKENCEYILLFIPVVGLIITAIINRWAVLYPYMCDYPVLPAVVGAVVPIILSGGSFLDGFIHTVDALSSHKSKEEKLGILTEDTHCGYSSIIVCICTILVAIGIWSEMPIDGIFVIAFAYIISRSLYAISVLTMKHAAPSKCSCYVPEKNALKWFEVLVNIGYICVCAVLMVNIAHSFANIPVAIACFVGAALCYVYYLWISFRHFGGITEELGGYFVVVCEVIIPVAALFIFKSPI